MNKRPWEKRNIIAVITILMVWFSFMSYAMMPARGRSDVRIVSASAISNFGPYPVNVLVEFDNYQPKGSALWIGVSFRTSDGKIIDCPPKDITRTWRGRDVEQLVYFLDQIPTTDNEILGSSYKWTGLKFTVGLWGGFDGRYMTGRIDQTGWLPVAGL